jgi:hypothetical protein
MQQFMEDYKWQFIVVLIVLIIYIVLKFVPKLFSEKSEKAAPKRINIVDSTILRGLKPPKYESLE